MTSIISLLTDFGVRDSYVAEVKAALVTRAPNAAIIDISHEVPPGNVRAAQYLLGRAWSRFPAGTVHLAVVDPGVGSDRRALAVGFGGHHFVAPDNGLLTPVLNGAEVVEIPVPAEASATFHGRDVFAPAAARLATGEVLSTLGKPVTNPVWLPLPQSREERGETVGEVVYVDRFGTLVTNIPEGAFAGAVEVLVGGEFTAQARRTFRDAPVGALVALVGSGRTIEVAARDQSAAQITGVGVGMEVRVRRAASGSGAIRR